MPRRSILDIALKELIRRHPGSEVIQPVLDGADIIGYYIKSPRGSYNVLAAIDKLMGHWVQCNKGIYSFAQATNVPILLYVRGKFYRFMLHDIYGSNFKVTYKNGKWLLRFDIRLGVNIESARMPLPRERAEQTNAYQSPEQSNPQAG
jgi:hypothetical protein